MHSNYLLTVEWHVDILKVTHREAARGDAACSPPFLWPLLQVNVVFRLTNAYNYESHRVDHG